VCPPKPGSLYPNLSEIEITESESDTEYTADSTEPATATLDEKTETETETASEADYYIQVKKQIWRSNLKRNNGQSIENK